MRSPLSEFCARDLLMLNPEDQSCVVISGMVVVFADKWVKSHCGAVRLN